MTVNEALKRINMHPADRCRMDGYFDEWDEETCAYILADEIERLRNAIKQHRCNVWGEGGLVEHEADAELYRVADVQENTK